MIWEIPGHINFSVGIAYSLSSLFVKTPSNLANWMSATSGRKCDLVEEGQFSRLTAEGQIPAAFPAAGGVSPSFLKGVRTTRHSIP